MLGWSILGFSVGVSGSEASFFSSFFFSSSGRMTNFSAVVS